MCVCMYVCMYVYVCGGEGIIIVRESIHNCQHTEGAISLKFEHRTLVCTQFPKAYNLKTPL